MLRLSKAILQWKPREIGGERDPIILLEAGWREIVGDDVARHCRPTRIADGTLTITTRSSAWSHQLSFLSEQLLRAVSARLPAAGIRAFRFRIGRLREPCRVEKRTSHSRAVRTGPHEQPEAASSGEALERFRRGVEQRRRLLRAHGWIECRYCGALMERVSEAICPSCAVARDAEIAAKTARLLYEAPWLGFSGTAALVEGLQEEAYQRIRKRMLAHWWGLLSRARTLKRIAQDGRERLIASSYVLLQSKLPPEAIMPATVRNILGDELHDLLYGDAGEGGTRNCTKTNR